MTLLHPPSNEQLNIINKINTNNVMVQAVAGSGKTTSILHIGNEYQDLSILVLTYNAKLKIETREKAKALGLDNIEIHSYHAFCVKYYDRKCFTDNKIITVLTKPEREKNNTTFEYDLIIIDEIQDMTPLYYKLVLDVLKRHTIKPKLCVLGDKYQNIFKFNKADSRFLTKSNIILDYNEYEWVQCTLTTSYRLTNQMSNFINDCVLNEKKIKTCKNGPDVEYHICDLFRARTQIYPTLKKIINEHSYGDIFILAPSVKSPNAPPRLLANILTDDKIPIYVPNSDEEAIDEDIVKGKIVFSTFHQSKGLERPIVFVYNFSAGYYTYFNKQANVERCCNELYVAITRASKKLILLHNFTEEYFNFINRNLLHQRCNVIEHMKPRMKKINESDTINPYAVTELLNHLPSTVIEHAKSYLTITKVHKKSGMIKINSKTRQGKYYENVSEITGTAIPSYFEYTNKNNMQIYTQLITDNVINNTDKRYFEVDDLSNFGKDKKLIDMYDISNLDIEKLLILSNMYCSHMSGYKYKLFQIKIYDWLSKNNLSKCLDRLKNHVDPNSSHETMFEYTNDVLQEKKKILVGAVDCIDKKNKNVWEFKCVNKLSDIHFLQIAIYSFMMQWTYTQQLNMELDRGIDNIDTLMNKYDLELEYKLFNILDNEIYKVECNYDKLQEMLNYLIDNKFNAEYEMPDIEFTKQVNKIRKEIFE